MKEMEQDVDDENQEKADEIDNIESDNTQLKVFR